MPPLPPVASVAKTTFKMGMVENVDILNRMYWQFNIAGEMSEAQATAIAAGCAASWSTNLASYINNGASLTEVEVIDLTSSTGAVGIWTGGDPGTHTSPALPAGTALVVSFPIARRYRGGHPRWYQAGLCEDQLQNSQAWTATFLSNFGPAFNAFTQGIVNAFNAHGSTLTTQCNVSYYEGFTNVLYPSGRYRAVPKLRSVPTIDTIGSAQPRSGIASQRRRNQYQSA